MSCTLVCQHGENVFGYPLTLIRNICLCSQVNPDLILYQEGFWELKAPDVILTTSPTIHRFIYNTIWLAPISLIGQQGIIGPFLFTHRQRCGLATVKGASQFLLTRVCGSIRGPAVWKRIPLHEFLQGCKCCRRFRKQWQIAERINCQENHTQSTQAVVDYSVL